MSTAELMSLIGSMHNLALQAQSRVPIESRRVTGSSAVNARLRLSIGLIVCLMLVFAAPAFADHPTLADPRLQTTVRFEFPGDTVKQTILTVVRCDEILRRKPLPRDVSVEYYKIDWWVFAALQDLDIPFKAHTVGKTGGPWKTTIDKIGKYTNGPDGKWVYFVNGIRSRYSINTQSDDDVREIRFVYEVPSSK